MKNILASLIVALATTSALAQTEITKIGMITMDRDYTIKIGYTPETARMVSYQTFHYGEENDEQYTPEHCQTVYHFILGRANIKVYANEQVVGEIQNMSYKAEAYRETKLNADHTCDQTLITNTDLAASVSDEDAFNLVIRNGNGDAMLTHLTFLGTSSIVKLGTIGDVVSSTTVGLDNIRASVEFNGNNNFRTTLLYTPKEWKDELALRANATRNWDEKD